MRNFKDIIEIIKDDFIFRRHVWLYWICIFLNMILMVIISSYGVIPDTEYLYSSEILPARYTFIFGLLNLCMIPIYTSMYTPAQWKDFNLVRELPRTKWFFSYFLILLFTIGYTLLQINIILIAPHFDGLLAYHNFLNKFKEGITLTETEFQRRYACLHTWVDLFNEAAPLPWCFIKNLYKLLSPEYIVKNHTLELLSIFINILSLVIMILVIIVVSGYMWNWFWWTYGGLIGVFCVDNILDTWVVEPFGFFFYSLVYLGDSISYFFIGLAVLCRINRETLINDWMLEHAFPIYFERQKVINNEFHFIEYLDSNHYQVFNSDGKKWPEKSNRDYTFYDKNRKRLTPLDSSKFQLFIGDPQNNCRIDSSQIQIYKNCVPIFTEEEIRTPQIEYNVYNDVGAPYPFINNTAYTLYDLNNKPLDISEYHIFDLKGNLLDYSFFCSSWVETKSNIRPTWTIDRKEHYIFDNECRLQDNSDIWIRRYVKKKNFRLKLPTEKN